MKIEVGKVYDLQLDKRYYQHNRDHAIGDIYDALVELITNADDSYRDLYRAKQRPRDGGDILVEHLEQRKGKPCFIVIRDRAEGLDAQEMESKLLRTGTFSSETGDRGYMGRGAKDCSALGDLTFESIKDDKFYRCKITHNAQFILEENGRSATSHDRQQLGVPHGNGTSVKVEIAENFRLPHFSRLAEELPWHYALRDIMGKDSDSRVLLRRLGSQEKPMQLISHPIEGELVVDEEFEVEGYPGAMTTLQIWRAPELIEETSPRFERFGILVKGTRAIHENSLLSDEFKKNPRARRYFGKIECPYLDQLLVEYEECRKNGKPHPKENPRLLIDPNRRMGLERQHPFVQKLLQLPIERLRALVAKDTEQENSNEREIANHETRNRLARLAKLAGRFLQDQLDELEELTTGESVDETAFAKYGILIYPTHVNVGVGKERTLTVYVKKALLANESDPVSVEAESNEAIEILGSPFTLHKHRSKEDRLISYFKVRGKAVCSGGVGLRTKCNGLPSAEARVFVVENAIEERNFVLPLEFEREAYRVRQGSRKMLRLFAKYPEVIASPTEVTLNAEDSSKVAVRGKCIMTPVAGSNYAEGFVTVEGRMLKSRASITAEVHGRQAQATVQVIESVEDERGVKLEFNVVDKDFGNFRARWADAEGKPHLLEIAARHKSLSRYLGSAPDFQGQNSPVFRVLLAEIVAESVCRKSLTMEAKERPFDFRWADLGKDNLIADDVLAKLWQRLRDFVAQAHVEMVNDNDLKKLNLDNNSSVKASVAALPSAQTKSAQPQSVSP